MCDYNELLHEADEMGIKVVEKIFKSDAKGLCKGNKIGIRKDMPEKEKTCILAEEIGHVHKTVGNILDQSIAGNRKQENVARRWAVDRLLTITDLFRAADAGCNNLFEVAEYLEVTEDFLNEAIEVFKTRYGITYTLGNKTITFLDSGFCIK